MKTYLRFIQTCLAALLLAACTHESDPTPAAGETHSVTLHVTTAPMQIVGEQVPYDTRAANPLMPQYENSIYSLAVLVFDVAEGVLQPFPAQGIEEQKYYKYINLTDANGDGVLNTTLSLESLPVQDNLEYTICLIANLPEDQVREIITSRQDVGGAVYLREFKNAYVAIPYVENDHHPDGLEIGHVESIYMFGYYEGVVTGLTNSAGQATTELSITLGRIISRLEMAFTVDEGVTLDPDKTFYCRMNRLESHARLFPTGVSPGADDPENLLIPGVISELSSLNNRQSTIYFYAAPHSAETEEEAMSLDLWYTERLTGPVTEDMLVAAPHATIQLCNDQPGVEDRNFFLNRNSVYRFNFNLTNK